MDMLMEAETLGVVVAAFAGFILSLRWKAPAALAGSLVAGVIGATLARSGGAGLAGALGAAVLHVGALQVAYLIGLIARRRGGD